MQTKFLKLTIVTFLIPLSQISVRAKSIPFHTTKSEVCPHGVHYINACKSSCSCDPKYGGEMCSRVNECDEVNKDICPLGEIYTDPTWGANFQCQCNKDDSQTYECFDLSSQNNYNLWSKRRL